jgi:penicillin amidase
MIYITNDGHIGLQVIGSFPVALDQEELGGYIKDGTTGKHDWIDIIKGRERLHISDPEKGYIVTANNRLTTKNFRDGRYASNWLITARAIRISEIIQHKIDRGHKLTVEDSKQIQLDTVDVFCRRMVSHLKTLNSEFRRLFDEWDCDFKPNSSKASIYSMFMWKLQMRLRPADIPIAGHPFFNQYTYRYILDTSTDDKEELQNLEGALK